MAVFDGVIVFFQDIGLYTVVLPFLLIFTLLYALLDKTRVLGVEEVGDKQFPKKNVNAMVAFVIAFFVVASVQLVGIINRIVSHVVLLVLLITFFMLLVGAMDRERKEGFQLRGWSRNAFYVIMFVGIILIFLDAFGWLQALWNYLLFNWDSGLVGIIVLLAVIIGLMWFVTYSPERSGKKESKEES